MEILPRQMLMGIFAYMSVRDLGVCLSVCHTWKMLASTNELWRLLVASSFGLLSCGRSSSEWYTIAKREAMGAVRYNQDESSSKYRLVKLIMIGDMGAGKSCFLQRFLDNTFRHTYIRTIGIDFRTQMCMYQGMVLKVKNVSLPSSCVAFYR